MKAQRMIAIEGLPDAALAASAAFYTDWMPRISTALGDDAESLVLVFPAAEADHRDWRLAAVRDLARARAPTRVNGLAGAGDAVERAMSYLAQAPGVTGQYLILDSQSTIPGSQ